MTRIRILAPGIAVSAALAVVCWFLGQAIPLVGGAVFAILAGMAIGIFWKDKGAATEGIAFTSKRSFKPPWFYSVLGFPLLKLHKSASHHFL